MRPYYEHAGITIYHGDCREILPTLEGIDVNICDPPYGVGRKYGAAYDDSPKGYWEWFVPCLQLIRVSAPVLAHTHRSIHAVRHIDGWDWIAVWHKPYSAGARIGNSPVLPHWEPIFLYGIYSLGNKRKAFADVISCNPATSPAQTVSASARDKIKSSSNGNHPLPKPEGLMRYLVGRLTLEGQTVCDCFAGSGTTLVAAQILGRRAIGIEIEEKYCEIAAKRLSQEVFEFSGGEGDSVVP